jgi:transcriptional regulator with XRE-family HTH domain
METRTLREVRKEIGVSQRALARMIGVNSSLISMAEGGFRSFRDDLWAQVQLLLKSKHELKNKQVAHTPMFGKRPEEIQDSIQLQMKIKVGTLRIKIASYQLKLNAMENTYKRAENKLKVFLQEYETFKKISYYGDQLKEMIRSAQKLVANNHPQLQQWIRIQIQYMEMSVANIVGQVNNMG